jgi:circadian clock protein KaiC
MMRSRFGVQGLDELLGGGLVKGDSALLAGSAGSGKTTLGLQFILAGVAAGENGIYVTFEELPDQLYRDSANFGWDLKKLEGEGKLRVMCTSPSLLLDPDAAEAILGRAIKETDAKRIVFDSLSHLAAFSDEKTMRLRVYSLLMLLKRYKMTSLMLWEISQLIGTNLAITDQGLSFLVDSIIILRPVEIDGRIRRALAVLKLRGSRHGDELRSYEITESGFTLGPPIAGFSGVLSGTPTRAQESLERLRDWLLRQPTKVERRDYRALCARVFAVPGVRYCAVRTAEGEVVEGGQKEGVPPIESDDERKGTGLGVTLISGLLSNAPRSFGKPAAVIVGFERVQLVAHSLGEGVILLVALESGSPPSSVAAIAEAVASFAPSAPAVM